MSRPVMSGRRGIRWFFCGSHPTLADQQMLVSTSKGSDQMSRKTVLFVLLVAGLIVPTTAQAARQQAPPGHDKVTICHKPGTAAEKTKQVPSGALKGHLGHGDTE